MLLSKRRSTHSTGSSGSDEVDTVRQRSGGIDVEIQKIIDKNLTVVEKQRMIDVCRNLRPEAYGRGTIETNKIKDVWSLYSYMKLRQQIIPNKFEFNFLIEVLENVADEETLKEVEALIEKYRQESTSKKMRLSNGSRSSILGDEKSPVEDMKTLVVNFDGPTTGNRLNHLAYKFNGKQLVVIINNFTESREGTIKDEENLTIFFNQLKTQNGVMSTIVSYPDLSKEKMEKFLVEIALELKRGIYDRLLVFILSHGKEDAVIGYHREFDQKNHNVHHNCHECENPMKIEKIYEIFEKSIPRKPKLFFLVACNGHQPLEQADYLSDMDDYSDSPPIMAPCPKRADMLIGCASVKGHISFRNSRIGTYYIHNLLEVFKSYMSDFHLVDMITEAQRRVSERISSYVENGTGRTGFVQMPYYQSSLRGPVYLLPRPSNEN